MGILKQSPGDPVSIQNSWYDNWTSLPMPGIESWQWWTNYILISPSAFGLWWNNYFHPDLWVALQKILHFLHPHCDPRSHDQKYPIFVSGRMGTSAQKMYPTPLVKFVMVMLKTNLVLSREIARESLQISGGHDNSLPSLPPFFSVSGSSICLWLSCVKALPFYLPSSLTGLLSRFLVECWEASSPLQATPGIWGINLGEMLLHLTSF